ncbi:MAG: hypothetical protein NZM65_06010 [Flavobacteriales bacterium]|nr:hypothetical protein [Flavobacteriales bacterium]MDW8410229.1 hypothetical protein [Flavobacteriales bacterium]
MLRAGKRWLLPVVVLALEMPAQAQMPWALRQRRLPVSDTIRCDTLFLLAGSISLIGVHGTLPDSCWRLLKGGKSIWLNNTCRLLTADSVTVLYKVLPVPAVPVALKDRQLIRTDSNALPELRFYQPDAPRRDNNLWGSINKNGSLTRGITVGNNQDLALNSALNMQLEGTLGHGVQVRAAITDENIPLQPEGTRQNLQDFDRVYIEVWKDRHKAIAGDYFVNRPRSYFLNVFKRAQGLQLTTALTNREIFGTKSPDGEMRVMISGSIARGRFARNQFMGIEGKQGPYQLRGADQETFIVVLSGTERVFIDGVLLKRGQEHDYIIDYNMAQITFTARQLITKDRRIVVEFEYSDRQYLRTMYHLNKEWDIGKVSLRLNIFSEQDSKNQPLQQALSPSQRELLRAVGDSVRFAVSPSAQWVDFSPHEILYEKRDTFWNGQPDTIFVYSTDPARARWRVTFTAVGPGQGDYEPTVGSANGRVFRYVGKNQGSFNPVVRLLAPRLQRMITLGATVRASHNLELETEAALSTLDRNLLSPLHNGDNHAPAFRLQMTHTLPLKKGEDSGNIPHFRWRFWGEYVHRNFQPFVRFRNVEFGRDWNITQYEQSGDEFLPGAGLEVYRGQKWSVRYEVQGFLKGSWYQAFRQLIQAETKTKRIYFRTWMTATPMAPDTNRSFFARHRTLFRWTFMNSMALELVGDDEYNITRTATSRRILSLAYAFSDWQVALTVPDSQRRFTWRLFYRSRSDWRPDTVTLRHTAVGHNAGVRLGWSLTTHQRMSATLEYRLLNIRRATLISDKPDNSLVSRLEYQGRFMNQSVAINFFYETGSGFEVRRTLSYLPVNNGQGTHFWDPSVDYNGNGVADLDEFQPATLPGQGNYMRVLVNTGELVRTFNNQFNANIFLRIPAAWRKSVGFKRFLSRWSLQGTYTTDRKTQTNNPNTAYNPFYSTLGDTALVAYSTSWRAALFFNRNEGRTGLDLNYRENASRLLLTNGPESRLFRSVSVDFRLNAGPHLTLNTELERQARSTEIPFLPTRNYRISAYSAAQKLTWQRGTRWRVMAGYVWSRRLAKDQTAGSALVQMHTCGPEFTFNVTTKGTATVRIQHIYIYSPTSVKGPLSFDLYDALQPGHNGSLGLNVQYTLGKNIQLNFQYEGRIGRFRPVHNGGVQVRAFF